MEEQEQEQEKTSSLQTRSKIVCKRADKIANVPNSVQTCRNIYHEILLVQPLLQERLLPDQLQNPSSSLQDQEYAPQALV